jgi:alpha-L-rhamnosidase
MKNFKKAHVGGFIAMVAVGGLTGETAGQSMVAPAAPSGLLVDLLPEPLVIEDLRAPRFSWVVEDGQRGAVQSAYQVVVATEPQLAAPGQADVWDSGKVSGSVSAAVAYAGPTLKPATRYHWTVRTWNGHDQPGPFAEPALFGTALHDQWESSPIWAEEGERSPEGWDDHPRSGNVWALLRTEFEVEKQPIEYAVLYATGVSPFPAAQHVYRAEINGAFVGVGPTRGYDGKIMYQAYDVTDRLEPGGNALAFVAYAAVGQAVQAQLDIVYGDGSRQRVATGSDWQARTGSDLFLDVGNSGKTSFHVAPREYVRFDRWPHGFSKPGFDASDWTTPVQKPALATLTGLGTRNLYQEERRPVHVEKIGDGAYRFDFVRSLVGGLRLRVQGRKGDQVDVRLGEELHPDGSVRFEMRTDNHYRDRWTLAEGEQTLEHFGYRVFRYAEVHGLPESVNPEDIVGVGLVYPFDSDAAHFSSSNQHLDEVWVFSRDSIRLLNMELYMDTPSRERRAYEADAYLQQLSHYALDREFGLARHSTDYLHFNYTWPTEWKLTAPTAAWRDYLQTGDDRSLALYYELLRDAKSIRHFMDERGLVVKDPGGAHHRDAWTDIVDWPPMLRDGYVFTEVNTVINTYNERSLRDLGKIAAVLGREDEAREWARLADISAAAINEHLFDREKGVYRDGLGVDHHALHASIYPLAFGLATEREAVAVEALADRRIVGNIFSAAFQVEALFEHGRADAAVDLLTTDDLMSWRNMIVLGAGTTMETWDPSLKPNTTYSHPAGASPTYLIPRGMFGIDAIEPAHRRFRVEPRPGGVEHAQIRLPTMSGTIEAAFEVSGPTLRFDLTVPANTVAEVSLPGEEWWHVREGGDWVNQARGVTVVGHADGMVQLEVGGGRYSFLSDPTHLAPPP